jgi:hypothetical protein
MIAWATSLKPKLGCWLHERLRTEAALCHWCPGDWLDLCNRNETLAIDPVSGGRICRWRFSSQLTVSRVFPQVGSRLLQACFQRWPLELNNAPSRPTCPHPEASVLLVVGGADRLGQFAAVLASLRGQSHEAMEIIVVEQSSTAVLEGELPGDVRYFHTPQPTGKGFNKSWALNVAARHARGDFLLIHDADYVVPRDYVRQCCRVLGQVESVRPSRFNFHLDQASTRRLVESRSAGPEPRLEAVVQNNPTPMAVRRKTYWDVGGHDERFVGWGGEDVEFLSRLRTRSISEGGWLPVIHLWHPPAPQKASGHRNQGQQDRLLETDPQERIDALRSRNVGETRSVTDPEAAPR